MNHRLPLEPLLPARILPLLGGPLLCGTLLATAAAQPAPAAPPAAKVAPAVPAAPGAPKMPAVAVPKAPTAAPLKATTAPAQPGKPDAKLDGTAPFTLAQATQGLGTNGTLRATIEVEQSGKALGTLRCDLFADKAPIAVANFVGLARGLRTFRDPRSGQWVRRPLYDGNQFHRLIPDFLIQGGDPLCQSQTGPGQANANQVGCVGLEGTGEPGYALADEIREDLHFDRGGRLGMALRGEPNTAGSQFFITDRETPWLNGSHTVFGQCEPVEVVHTIARLETGPQDVPKVPVRIKRVSISRQQTLAPK